MGLKGYLTVLAITAFLVGAFAVQSGDDRELSAKAFTDITGSPRVEGQENSNSPLWDEGDFGPGH